ncbi:MAG: hypothetical protein ACLQVF_36800 [Isosphaeraceae bacterium]
MRMKIAVAAMAMLAGGIGLTDSGPRPPAVTGRAQTGPGDRGADSLPKFARARLGDLRFYHGEWVRRAVYTPDGRSLVTLDQQGRLRVWDAASGRTYRTIGDPALRVSEFAVSPDGTTLATDNSLSRLQLWDMATGRERRRWHEPRESTHSDPRFSPDGRTIAVIATRPSGDPRRNFEAFVELVDTTGPTERRRRIVGGWTRLRDLRFSPDGRALATSGNDSAAEYGPALKTSVRLWDVAERRELWRASFQGLQVGPVALSPDGKRLAADLSDGTIRVYDPATGREIAPRLIRPDAPRPGEPPPPRHPAEQATRDLMDGMACLAFSPDGTTLAAGSRGSMNTGDVWMAGVHLWDVASGRFLRRIAAHQGWIDSLDFSPDGRTLATTGIEVVVRVWGVADGREVVPQVGHRTAIKHLVVAPDGRSVFTAGLDGTVREWDAASGRDRGIFARFPGYIHGMAVAPDGKSLVVSALFDGVTLWDVAGRRLVRRFEHDEPESPVHGLAFAPDGRTLVSGREAWDVATGRVVGTFPAPGPDRRQAAAYSPAVYTPDGRRVLVPGSGGVSIWDRVAGRVERKRLPGGLGAPVSRDGRLLAMGGSGPRFAGDPHDPSIRVYEIATGREVRKLAGHEGGTRGLAFSPDGRWLASGGVSTDATVRFWDPMVRDATVRIWDLATGRELRRFEGHLASVNVVAFSPDGRSLVSAGADGMAFVWDLSDLRAGEAADAPRPRRGLSGFQTPIFPMRP